MRGWLALVLLGGSMAGCLGGGEAPLEPGSVGGPAAAGAGLASFLHDLSPADEGIEVLTSELLHLPIAAPDGVLLDTWVVVPPSDNPVPLVLEVTPYYTGGAPLDLEERTHRLGRLADELVPRGYAVGVSSVRGTGSSGGCFSMGGPGEALDTAAVIEALAAAPWSNGRVGLIGVSYPGTTPQDVWVEAPPSLKTIVPISGISDLYKYNFVNGVHIQPQGFAFNAYYWVLVGLMGFEDGVQSHPASVPGAIAGEACTEQVEVQEGGASSAVDGNKDAYWQARDFLAELEADLAASPGKERASVFYIHGLQDWNVKPHHLEDWLPAVQAAGVPFKAWLGQWGHAWPQSGNPEATCEEDDACRNDWWNATLVAWFDQFLKGVDTGILGAPAVQVQDDAMRWRHEDHWPPLDVEAMILHLHADGTLRSAGEGPGSGEVAYHDHPPGRYPAEVQAILGPDRAVFVSDPVAEDLHLSGQVVYEGDVTASGRRANLVFTLAERNDTAERSIGFAALSLNHAQSLAQGKDDISGERQHVALRFFPQDDVVRAGSRLVLIAAGNTVGGPGPNLTPVRTGGEITLHLDGALLTLPVDRTLAYEEPAPYDPAEEE